jgi:hypothetical protein
MHGRRGAREGRREGEGFPAFIAIDDGNNDPSSDPESRRASAAARSARRWRSADLDKKSTASSEARRDPRRAVIQASP